MRISRIYTDQSLGSNASIELSGATSHYLTRVLRLQEGAELIVFNGDGQEYPAAISATGKKYTTLHLGAPYSPATESRLHSVLGLGISRGERMDYAIQKSTELGVSIIVPLFTEHCEVKLVGDRQEKRLEHWQQVAISACEQSGRVKVPLLAEPQNLQQWINSNPAQLKLVFDHTQAQALPSDRPEQGVALLIGPEGGLSEREISLAREAGFIGVALGNRVLRTETAPVAALSVLQYLWG